MDGKLPLEPVVSIVAPLGGDALGMAGLLEGEGIETRVCEDLNRCLEVMEGASVLLLTEEALESAAAAALFERLEHQPAWSELPVIILTRGGESRVTALLDMAAAAAGSVTLLERPMSAATLVRSVQVALRSRQRQYQIRDLLAEKERLLREVEGERARLQAVLEALPVGVWVADASGRMIMVNSAVESIWGGKPFMAEELEQYGTYKVWRPGTEGQLPVEQYPLVRALGGEAVKEIILDHERFDGTRGTHIASSTPIRDAQGNIRGAVAIALDITRLRQAEEALRASEEQFRTLADCLPSINWWANTDGHITWFNARAYEYTGKTPEEIGGWGWRCVHDPEMLPKVMERWEGCIATGEPFEMEVRLRGADGQFRWFLGRVVPVKDAVGKVVRWFGTNTEISEQKNFQAELERLVAERTAKLQEMVAELEHVSYTISHDMRAPLRAMRAFSEMLKDEDEGLSQEGKGFVERIITGAERMDALITDALHYTKTVRTELPVGPVDLGRLLRGMLGTYPQFQAPAAEIVLDGELPVVIGNEGGLTQCFSNLLDNAVKFARPGVRPQIRVRVETVKSEECSVQNASQSGWARIWVEDNGIGISKEMLPRVFQMFARGASAQAGTGIGLALVRKVVERMGGRVGVESEPGKGSRFWVELKGQTRAPGMR